ncbi:hypothetical protein C8F01DRAFT_1373318 [Mycena amicta]|nr:hypothetical protein C8F01DRAFT_1373318 [Mycena amicta]
MDDGGRSARRAWLGQAVCLYATQPEHVAPPQTYPAKDSPILHLHQSPTPRHPHLTKLPSTGQYDPGRSTAISAHDECIQVTRGKESPAIRIRGPCSTAPISLPRQSDGTRSTKHDVVVCAGMIFAHEPPALARTSKRRMLLRLASHRRDLAKAGLGFSLRASFLYLFIFSWLIRVVFAAHSRNLDSRLLPLSRVDGIGGAGGLASSSLSPTTPRPTCTFSVESYLPRLPLQNALRVLGSSPPNELPFAGSMPTALSRRPTPTTARPTTPTLAERAVGHFLSSWDTKLIYCVCYPLAWSDGTVRRLSRDCLPDAVLRKVPHKRLRKRTARLEYCRITHRLTLAFLEDPAGVLVVVYWKRWYIPPPPFSFHKNSIASSQCNDRYLPRISVDKNV